MRAFRGYVLHESTHISSRSRSCWTQMLDWKNTTWSDAHVSTRPDQSQSAQAWMLESRAEWSALGASLRGVRHCSSWRWLGFCDSKNLTAESQEQTKQNDPSTISPSDFAQEACFDLREQEWFCDLTKKKLKPGIGFAQESASHQKYALVVKFLWAHLVGWKYVVSCEFNTFSIVYICFSLVLFRPCSIHLLLLSKYVFLCHLCRVSSLDSSRYICFICHSSYFLGWRVCPALVPGTLAFDLPTTDANGNAMLQKNFESQRCPP